MSMYLKKNCIRKINLAFRSMTALRRKRSLTNFNSKRCDDCIFYFGRSARAEFLKSETVSPELD